MNTTYQQEVKEQARRLLWTKAITALTVERDRARILEETFVEHFWRYCFDECLARYSDIDVVDNGVLTAWLEHMGRVYRTRSPADLKIAYLCGPEPQNDLEEYR